MISSPVWASLINPFTVRALTDIAANIHAPNNNIPLIQSFLLFLCHKSTGSGFHRHCRDISFLIHFFPLEIVPSTRILPFHFTLQIFRNKKRSCKSGNTTCMIFSFNGQFQEVLSFVSDPTNISVSLSSDRTEQHPFPEEASLPVHSKADGPEYPLPYASGKISAEYCRTLE